MDVNKPKLTKRQSEIAYKLSNGSTLYVVVSRSRHRKPSAFITNSENIPFSLVRSDELSFTSDQKISWSIVEALERMRIVKPERRLPENERVWLYGLVDSL